MTEQWRWGHNETKMFTLSTPLREALDSYADANDISVAEAIRRAISQLVGVEDPGRRRKYSNDEERRAARLERRAKRREKRRTFNV